MKRIAMGIIAGIIAILLATSVTGAEVQYKVLVDGEWLKSDVPPMNVEGRLLVPLRAVSEALGAQVSYDAESHTAVIYSKAAAVAPSAAQSEELQALTHLRLNMKDNISLLLWAYMLSKELRQAPDQALSDEHWGMVEVMEKLHSADVYPDPQKALQIVNETCDTQTTLEKMTEPPTEFFALIKQAKVSYDAKDMDTFNKAVNEIHFVSFMGWALMVDCDLALAERTEQVMASMQGKR